MSAAFFTCYAKLEEVNDLSGYVTGITSFQRSKWIYVFSTRVCVGSQVIGA